MLAIGTTRHDGRIVSCSRSPPLNAILNVPHQSAQCGSSDCALVMRVRSVRVNPHRSSRPASMHGSDAASLNTTSSWKLSVGINQCTSTWNPNRRFLSPSRSGFRRSRLAHKDQPNDYLGNQLVFGVSAGAAPKRSHRYL